MSIFVPRVFANFSDERIVDVFEHLDMGIVSHIDRIAKTDRDGKKYHSIYIHFESWNYANSAVLSLHEKLNAGESVRIVYDDPWYWTVLKNTTHKKTEEEEAADLELGEIQEEMEAEPSFDLVDTEYVSKIEAELERLRNEVKALTFEKKHDKESIVGVQQEMRNMMEERDYYNGKACRLMSDYDVLEEENKSYAKALKNLTKINVSLQAQNNRLTGEN